MNVFTVDTLCSEAETLLRAQVPPLLVALALDTDLKPLTTWQQVPTMEALSTAKYPAGAITSPGLVKRPTRTRSSGYVAVWRLAVAVYDRGRDHADTAHRARTWASVIRAVMLDNPTVNGVASGVEWVGEDYAQEPGKREARTIGGCAVTFDVTVGNVHDTTPNDRPTVQATRSTVTVRST